MTRCVYCGAEVRDYRNELLFEVYFQDMVRGIAGPLCDKCAESIFFALKEVVERTGVRPVIRPTLDFLVNNTKGKEEVSDAK